MRWSHDSKMRFAREIGRRVGARFGDRILFGTVVGSVARGDDTPRSDLDLMFLTRQKVRLPDMSPDGYREFLYGDLKTQLEFRTKEEALEILRNTGPYWPFQAKDFLEPRIIRGDSREARTTVEAFGEVVNGLPDVSFMRGAGHALLWTRQAVAKVQNAVEQKDEARAFEAGVGLARDVAAFVALANRRYYHFADLRLLGETATFPSVPETFQVSLRRLILSREVREIETSAQGVWSICQVFAEEQAISMESHGDLSALGI